MSLPQQLVKRACSFHHILREAQDVYEFCPWIISESSPTHGSLGSTVSVTSPVLVPLTLIPCLPYSLPAVGPPGSGISTVSTQTQRRV